MRGLLIRVALGTALAVLALPRPCEAASRTLRNARKAFQSFDYEGLVPQLKRAARQTKVRTELADIYRMMGIVHAAYGEPALAKRAFLRAFELQPDLEIGGDFPPKIRDPFFEVQQQAKERRPSGATTADNDADRPTDQVVQPTVDATGDATVAAPSGEKAAASPDGEAFPPVDGALTAPASTEIVAAPSSSLGFAANPVLLSGPNVSTSRPAPFYAEWWFWTAVGVVVAAGGGTAVYLMTRESVPASDFGPYEVR